ncbi:MAG: baseplate J/gp47 family protein [Myxococcales bacterium]|nr:baseplate J/gp47 family protein [Myxococcales bacterium]
MPIASPQLDDLRYSRIVEELVRRIPVYAPQWTNHNDSDPGIALLQLFASLTEQVGYRLNRVPDKVHVALLELLGVKLRTARAAHSQVALFLSNPRVFPGVVLQAGSEVTRGSEGSVTYETDTDLDVVPAEVKALVTTRNPWLWDLLKVSETQRDPVPTGSQIPDVPADHTEWMTVTWKGDPPPKELPLQPAPLLGAPTGGAPHPYLWLGVSGHEALAAGFLGVEITLHVVLDDDEVPTSVCTLTCEPIAAAGQLAPPPVTWLSYVDGAGVRRVPGRIVDTTDQLARSGTIRFTVPLDLGAPAEWVDLRPEVQAVVPDGPDLVTLLKDNLPGTGLIELTGFHQALANAVQSTQAQTVEPEPAVAHPLDPELRAESTINGWIRIGPLPADRAAHRVRHVGFNVVGVTGAETVTNRVVGTGDGRPTQQLSLPHTRVLERSLRLEIAESAEPDALLTSWTEIGNLDEAGPFDRVYELDPEAGLVTFGDGEHGAIPPLVPRAGQIVARRYRHGGGLLGNAAEGEIDKLAIQATGLAGVVNVVPARGGDDPETLQQAKERARKELATRHRAVTATDFTWLATQTPSVRVGRAIVVPRRRPLSLLCPPAATPEPPPPEAPDPCTPCSDGSLQLASEGAGAVSCGAPLPTVAGLDDALVAPGVVSVVVVPDEAGPEPLPTPGFLREVCCWLDQHRLVTTEIHVVPPQYVRLCNVYVQVRGEPGHSRLLLQERVSQRLATFLHVLTGGADGTGAPFGTQLHIADLVAEVFRTEGVAGVEMLTADFVRTKSNAQPRTGRLVQCPVAPGETDRIDLSAEETTSLDPQAFTLATAAP